MKKFGIYVVLALSLLFSCTDDEKNSTPAHLEVRLTDAPGDYQQVNVDIQDVQVNSGSDEGGWTSLDVNKGVYDLLKLSNGLDTLLGSVALPAGKISQVRLILGSKNSIKVDDQMIDLSTPSAQQSGLKLKVNAELQEGVTYKLLLDFDAARSIVKAGASGRYNLKPVIRTILESENGAIKGLISPIESSPAVYAIEGSDTVGTAFADQETGKFLIKGLNAGTYKVTFEPKEGYQSLTKDGVTVTNGMVTDLGTVTITQ
ncbi:MAG TPA: DUF4382 domain-containing protein [Cyclobacteriaceae bacterium]|nr:DUF4382 domain-containing protein [Cyclobacteriaceae bacterium]